MPDLVISANRLITPAAVLAPGWLRVRADRIEEVHQGRPPEPASVQVPDGIVCPGFVDAHVHGGGGDSFTAGTAGAARRVTAVHLAHGTTTMMASLVTDSSQRLHESVAALAPLVRDGTLCGIHLEGPWLSPDHRGAHDAAHLVDPDPALIESLLATGQGTIRMVTLAPELPGGLAAVRQLTEAGVVAAIGHTDATFEQTQAAIDAGARVGTHLFNAMRALHHREPGPVVALLDAPGTYVEVIADGVHLHPAVIRRVAAAKGERLVLVTDAMAAAAAVDGMYQLGPMAVRVEHGTARLVSTGAIAGSTLTMAAALRYAVRTAELPLADAVRAATATPADMLGLPATVGRLTPGARADLVVLSDDLDVRRVMRAGRWVGTGAEPGPELSPPRGAPAGG